jgi:hypothetical protein
VWGGSKPERDPGRFHGLVSDRQQLGRDGVQVELVAQADAVGRDGRGRGPHSDPADAIIARVELRRSRRVWARWDRRAPEDHGQPG